MNGSKICSFICSLRTVFSNKIYLFCGNMTFFKLDTIWAVRGQGEKMFFVDSLLDIVAPSAEIQRKKQLKYCFYEQPSFGWLYIDFQQDSFKAMCFSLVRAFKHHACED